LWHAKHSLSANHLSPKKKLSYHFFPKEKRLSSLIASRA
jgi:hypothetical protein